MAFPCALLVLRLASGTQVVINDMELAIAFVVKVSAPSLFEEEFGHELRATMVTASHQAHSNLNDLSGTQHQFMGTASKKCKTCCPRPLAAFCATFSAGPMQPSMIGTSVSVFRGSEGPVRACRSCSSHTSVSVLRA